MYHYYTILQTTINNSCLVSKQQTFKGVMALLLAYYYNHDYVMCTYGTRTS